MDEFVVGGGCGGVVDCVGVCVVVLYVDVCC